MDIHKDPPVNLKQITADLIRLAEIADEAAERLKEKAKNLRETARSLQAEDEVVAAAVRPATATIDDRVAEAATGGFRSTAELVTATGLTLKQIGRSLSKKQKRYEKRTIDGQLRYRLKASNGKPE